MHPRQKLQRIYTSLRVKGHPGTAYQVAKLLQVAPSTVGRWEKGSATPQGRTAESLDLLYRTVVQAERGNADADKILGAILGGVGASLLGIGLGGILVAAGLGWLLGSDEEEK